MTPPAVCTAPSPQRQLTACTVQRECPGMELPSGGCRLRPAAAMALGTRPTRVGMQTCPFKWELISTSSSCLLCSEVEQVQLNPGLWKNYSTVDQRQQLILCILIIYLLFRITACFWNILNSSEVSPVLLKYLIAWFLSCQKYKKYSRIQPIFCYSYIESLALTPRIWFFRPVKVVLPVTALVHFWVIVKHFCDEEFPKQ